MGTWRLCCSQLLDLLVRVVLSLVRRYHPTLTLPCCSCPLCRLVSVLDRPSLCGRINDHAVRVVASRAVSDILYSSLECWVLCAVL